MSILFRFLLLLILIYNPLNLFSKTVEAEKSTPKTVIKSDKMELKSTDEKNYFYFDDNVRVIGTNLIVNCDHLEVVSGRSEESKVKIGKIGAVDKIVATGKVRIFQADRQAHAGRADLLPKEGKVILTDSPKVIDKGTEISGWKITLYKDQRKAVVEKNPDAPNTERPTIILDAIPDLGFDPDKKEKEE